MRKLQLICDLRDARIDAAVERVINKHSGPLVIDGPEPAKIPTHREALAAQIERLRAARSAQMAQNYQMTAIYEQMALAQGQSINACRDLGGLQRLALGYLGA